MQGSPPFSHRKPPSALHPPLFVIHRFPFRHSTIPSLAIRRFLFVIPQPLIFVIPQRSRGICFPTATTICPFPRKPYNQTMADQLYLSLWYPNFRLAALPQALVGVLRQFAVIAKDGKTNSPFGRVAAASAFPIDWTESPIYQRIYVNDGRAADSADTEGSIIENAVAEATEQLHDDTAYEFEMLWNLWQPETGGEGDYIDAALDTRWNLQPARVRITGFGPNFDTGSYEQNGHIRIDFGLDTPWTFETEDELDTATTKLIQGNVEKLLAFTLSVEKHCGISSRLLWTESGEPLAEKLIAKLQRLN
jgi:hypothetical protein